MDIEPRVAAITGASQGIGAALVKAYRDRNYGVVAPARSVPIAETERDGQVVQNISSELLAPTAFSSMQRITNTAGKEIT